MQKVLALLVVKTNLVIVVGLRMNKISYKIATKLSRVWKLQNENYRICIYAVINTV